MPALRSFKSYARTTPFQLLTDANALFPCFLADLDGNIAAGNKWLQLHDVAVALAGGEVPLKSFNAGAAAGPLPSLFQQIGPVTFRNGLTIAISSTEATYTADATSYDVFGEIEEYEPQNVDNLGTSTVGDLSTGVNALTVWADGAGPKFLYKLVVSELVSAKHFVCINSRATFAEDADFTLRYPLTSGQGLTQLNFGVGGLSPLRNRGESGTFNLHNGCYIKIIDADANGNFPVGGPYNVTAGSATIKAWFK
jgi:hypothetical protein